jgi:transcriptional regulator of acetoin/glycerol metabolism
VIIPGGPMENSHTDKIYQCLKDGTSSAKSAVAASWSRSLTQHGLDPDARRSPQRLSDQEMKTTFDGVAPLLASAQETLDRLFQIVGQDGSFILMSDRNGVIVDRRITVADETAFPSFMLGTIWSEASVGTNGLGTALKEARPVTIRREQHFLTNNTNMTCTAAPIRDGYGKIIGALDVSVCQKELSRSVLKMLEVTVSEAAQKIEARCFRTTFSNARIMLIPDSTFGAGGAVAVDRHDLVIGANYVARRTYGLGDKDLLNPFPATEIFSADAAQPDDLEEAEHGAIRRALARAHGNVSMAAKALGISRITLHRKIAQHRDAHG